MTIEALRSEQVADFIDYCKKHKGEIDDSFLYEEDLRDFTPDDENPTYIARNSTGEIIATASLIMDDYNKRGKKGRFRIFHSVIDDIECYRSLMKAILKHTEGLEKVIVFVPIVNKRLIEMVEGLQFNVERYSFLLVRENLEVPKYHLPENYEIRPFQVGRDEGKWCEVRNAGFAKLQGSETPATPEMITRMTAEDNYMEGGLMILYHEERPVGIIRGARDEYEGGPIMDIGPLALLPEYQGMGLGRSLLRASLNFAKEKGYERAVLCVNAENERAKALYIQEGFNQVEAVACYKYDLVNVMK